MTPSQVALARSKGYRLFRGLYLNGLNKESLLALSEIPEFSTAIAEPFDEDEAAVNYQHIFGFNVFPYASVFLDPQIRLGGLISQEVERFFQMAGYAREFTYESADHLGNEMGFLGFLTEQEFIALENQNVDVVKYIRDTADRFFQSHLLFWLPAFVQAIRQQGDRIFTLLAELTLDLVVDHFNSIHEGSIGDSNPIPETDTPSLLENQNTGLREIAEFLATPARSGIFLSRDDIRRLGRMEQVPVGFGDRVLLLTNLLRTAVEYDCVTAILESLTLRVNSWRTAYHHMLGDTFTGSHFLDFWTRRLDTTEEIIFKLTKSVAPECSK